MSKYRINVRFDTDDPKHAEAVKFLQSLEPVSYTHLNVYKRQEYKRSSCQKNTSIM